MPVPVISVPVALRPVNTLAISVDAVATAGSIAIGLPAGLTLLPVRVTSLQVTIVNAAANTVAHGIVISLHNTASTTSTATEPSVKTRPLLLPVNGQLELSLRQDSRVLHSEIPGGGTLASLTVAEGSVRMSGVLYISALGSIS